MAFSGSGIEHWNPNASSETANIMSGIEHWNPNASSETANVISGSEVEHPLQNVHPGVSLVVAAPVTPGESAKKKRGRPRKYAPDGTLLALALSPSSGSATSSETKSTRGRPPGTGWKQQLAPLGEWMNYSAGLAFTPHFILVGPTEDVTAKIMSFAMLRSRALCILSATGSVSAATLRQPLGYVTYEGSYDIICLQGSYFLEQDGGPHIGGHTISMSTPDGQVIGGVVGGRVIAESEVKVVAFSFAHGGKPKNNNEASENGEKSSGPPSFPTPVITAPNCPTGDLLRSVKTEIEVKQE